MSDTSAVDIETQRRWLQSEYPDAVRRARVGQMITFAGFVAFCVAAVVDVRPWMKFACIFVFIVGMVVTDRAKNAVITNLVKRVAARTDADGEPPSA